MACDYRVGYKHDSLSWNTEPNIAIVWQACGDY